MSPEGFVLKRVSCASQVSYALAKLFFEQHVPRKTNRSKLIFKVFNFDFKKREGVQ